MNTITTPIRAANTGLGTSVSWPCSSTSPSPATSMADAISPKKILKNRVTAIAARGKPKVRVGRVSACETFNWRAFARLREQLIGRPAGGGEAQCGTPAGFSRLGLPAIQLGADLHKVIFLSAQ